MRKRVHTGSTEHALSVEVLDRLAIGIVICNSSGRLAFVNAAAEGLHRRARLIFSLSRKTIAAMRLDQSQKLLRLIASAASGGSGGAMSLSSVDGSDVILALVSPLPKSVKESLEGHALVALRRPSEDAEFTGQVLAQLFGLSPSQANLALALYNGSTVEDFADKRGVKVSTIRSHLAEILAKTGTSNQRDLVRLIGMLPPLRAEI